MMLIELSQSIQYHWRYMKPVSHRGIAKNEGTWQRWVHQPTKQLGDFLLHLFTVVLQLAGCANGVGTILDLRDQRPSGSDKYSTFHFLFPLNLGHKIWYVPDQQTNYSRMSPPCQLTFEASRHALHGRLDR